MNADKARSPSARASKSASSEMAPSCNCSAFCLAAASPSSGSTPTSTARGTKAVAAAWRPATGLFSDNLFLSARFRHDQGFDAVVDVGGGRWTERWRLPGRSLLGHLGNTLDGLADLCGVGGLLNRGGGDFGDLSDRLFDAAENLP